MPKGRYEEGHFKSKDIKPENEKEDIPAQGKLVGEDGLTHSDPIQTDCGGVALPGMTP